MYKLVTFIDKVLVPAIVGTVLVACWFAICFAIAS